MAAVSLTGVQAGRGFCNPASDSSLPDAECSHQSQWKRRPPSSEQPRVFNPYDLIADTQPIMASVAAAAENIDDDEYLQPAALCDYWGMDQCQSVNMTDNHDCTVKYIN